MRSGVRVKAWDNHAFRVLPVTNFVMILPMDLRYDAPTVAIIADRCLAGRAPATNAQVAELMDDMLMFQSDTRNDDVRPRVRASASSPSPRCVIGIAIYLPLTARYRFGRQAATLRGFPSQAHA